MIRSLSSATAACGLVMVAASGALAAPIDLTNPASSATLAQILGQAGNDAGHFIVADKEFHVLTFAPTPGAPPAFSAANITVVGRDNGLNGTGFRFFAQWADNPGDPSTFGFTFEYDVNILAAYVAQGYRITGVNLAFNGAASGVGSVASVDETVFDGQTFLGSARVFADGSTGTSDQDDMVPFTPRTGVNVIKDFKVFSPSANGLATVSFIEQTFKQIPTPGSGATALCGFLVLSRRRR
jgi:hypothetical protein